jgi:hypothetical protein
MAMTEKAEKKKMAVLGILGDGVAPDHHREQQVQAHRAPASRARRAPGCAAGARISKRISVR